MARSAARWVIGTFMVAALCSALPSLSTILAPDATSLAYVAALAVLAVIAVAASVTSLPVPGVGRLQHTWDRGPDELTRQSDPSAAGHSRPRAPDHS